MKIIKPVGDNVILKGTIKESTIITSTNGDPTKGKKIEAIHVFLVGDKVEGIKEGAEVRINPMILSETARVIDPFEKIDAFDRNKEFYLVCKKEEIIGIF